MNAIYFTGVGQAILVIALLFSRKLHRKVDSVLALWMLIGAFQLIFFYLNFVGETDALPRLMLVGGVLQFLGAPILYVYIKSLTDPGWPIQKMVLHAVPFLLFMALFQFHYEEGKIWVSDGFIHVRGASWMARNYSSFLAITSLVYPLVSLFTLRKHRLQIEDEFSYNEEITLNWLNHWVILELVGFIVSYVVIWGAEFEVFTYVQSFQILASIILLNVFIVGFFGLKQPIIFTEEEPDLGDKYRKSSLGNEKTASIKSRLNQAMESERAFLNPKLSLHDLADQIGASKHEVSQVLNDSLKTNFYDFVNAHRVETFKERLNSGEYDHLSMLGLALECGFNSKSSFNQVFKKQEGVTPTTYKKGLIN